MAEPSTDIEGSEQKKKNILEEKSHEDLVKHVKKQLILLQKAKSKTDELTKKCQVLEQEKIANAEEHSKEKQKLLNEIKFLKNSNLEIIDQKEHEISKLKEERDTIENEKNKYFILSRENEEQLQCLTMQLDTVKATCQCLQEELQKSQNANKDLSDEVTLLMKARDTSLKSLKAMRIDFDNKLNAQDKLLIELDEIKKKYRICIEENCALTSKIESLTSVIKNNENEKINLNAELQKLKELMCNQSKENVTDDSNDFSILIQDNQSLREKIALLETENKNYKVPGTPNIAHLDNKCNKLMDIENENVNLQSALVKAESLKSNLQSEKEALKDENKSCLADLEELHIKLKEAESSLRICENEKMVLKKAIEDLSYTLQHTDSSTAIEQVLLYGADTESLMNVEVKSDVQSEKSEPKIKIKNISSRKSIEFSDIGLESEGTSFELALLEGGDVNQLYASSMYENDENSAEACMKDDSDIMIEIEGGVCMTKGEILNIIDRYEQLQKETDIMKREFSFMANKLDTCSTLLQETQEENEVLKSKLEKHEDIIESPCLTTMHADKAINTDENLQKDLLITQSAETKTIKSFSLKEENDADLTELLPENDASKVEEGDFLSEQIISLKSQNEDLSKTLHEYELSNECLSTQSKIIEKQNIELSEKLEKKCTELNDFNLQLELLVIGIKQGVRQKSATTYQTENPLSENMNMLKLLLDDLITKSNSNTLKIKNLESDLKDCLLQKSDLEDEILQVKELNQFLEDEAVELRDEVVELKSNLTVFENLQPYAEKSFEAPAELYSIEEDNELEDKPTGLESFDGSTAGDSENTGLDLANTKQFSDASTITVVHSLNDASVQVDFGSSEMETDLNKFNNDSLNFDKIMEENNYLKDSLNDKSKLVERIHCEMDNLLTKVEELTIELQEKEDDLKFSNCAKADLQKTLNDLSNIERQRKNALKDGQNVLSQLKIVNKELMLDLQSLFSFSDEIVTELSNKFNDVTKSFFYVSDYYRDRCSHAETNFSAIKSYVNSLTKSFEEWVNIIQESTKLDENVFRQCLENYEVGKLEEIFKQLENSCSNSNEQKQEESLYCSILNDFELLNTTSKKLWFEIHNYFETTKSFTKELSNSESHSNQFLEKKVRDLENKLLEYSVSKTMEGHVGESLEKADDNSVENLKHQLAETEVKMNKLKQLALKLKKEIASVKKQYEEAEMEKNNYLQKNAKVEQELEKYSTENCQLVQNYQSLQNEYDKLQDECDIKMVNCKKIEEELSCLSKEHSTCKDVLNDLEYQLNKSKQMLESSALSKQDIEAKCAEFDSKIIILESSNQEKVKKIQDLEGKIEQNRKEVYSVLEENKKLKEKLDLAQKEGKKKNLMDLEMADYERSITELNNQILKKENDCMELQNDLKCLIEKNNALQEEIKSTEMLKETEEKRASNLKEVLEKTKLELSSIREHEAELLEKNSSLHIQLEEMTQQAENYKLQLSESSAQVQNLIDMMKVSSENHQRIVKTLESKISTQKQEILIAHKEVESIKQEFDSYKIRVHSVLKQQKTSTPAITSVEGDLKEKLETLNEKLKLQVKDFREKLTAVTLEYEALQEEHENLLQKYNKALDEKEQKYLEWQKRLDQLTAEKNRLAVAQEELSSQHLLQNEMLVATYKKQIKIMSEEHKRTVNDLQKQLDEADIEISRLQREQQKTYGVPPSPSLPENAIPFDILSQERQEGEGSESTDDISTPIRHLSLATIPTSGFLPFDKLLQSPLEPGTPTSVMSTHDSEKLYADLSVANKKVEHLSELLNDSESTNLRFGEQVRVLKEELRRLERNKEREKHAENLEYLKNVFIKFTMLQPGSEKSMLIPVLTTMLKLSPDEQQQLKTISGDIDSDDTSSSGWGSYLHRWSGLA